MKVLNFRKIDAFTSGLSSGNPAACILLSDNEKLSEKEMQNIASELGDFVCETAFVRPVSGEEADFEFRYFSKEAEVPFCGHATIAVCHNLIRESQLFTESNSFKIKTKNGILSIFNEYKTENSVYIEAPEPCFHEHDVSINEMADAINLNPDEIDKDDKLICLNVGQKIILVPIMTYNSIIQCKPEFDKMKSFSDKHGIDIIVIYSADSVFQENDFRTRVFPPAFGYLEDPATGSGNAALAYHQFINCGRSEEKITIEQGTDKLNPNIIKLKKNGSSVLIGGSAVMKIEGKYYYTGDPE
ncbi:MAG: PhzF family phenazine biosynthesis protein [Spirochaetes bacterium]|nr:PhzF family phenazine biosynthesis protein [Spirochaetota bacterium]